MARTPLIVIILLASLVIGGLTVQYSYWPLLGIVFLGLFVLALISPEKALLGLIFYLPFQIALNLAPGIDLASIRALILLLFSAWILFLLAGKSGKIPTKLTRFDFGLLFFLLWSAASLFWALNFEWGLRKIAVFVSIFPLYFLVRGVIAEKKQIKKAVSFLVAGAAVVSAIGLIQFFAQFFAGLDSTIQFWARNVASLFYGRTFSQAILNNSSWLVNIGGKTYFRAISFFPDPHMLAFYLEMTLPLALIMFFADFRARRLVPVFLILFALFLTFSRGGYFGFMASSAAMLAVAYLALVRKGGMESFLKNHFKPALLVFLLMLVAIPAFYFGPAGARFKAGFSLSEGSNVQRIRTWQQAFAVIGSAPFAGVGVGSYALAVNSKVGYRDPIYAHNTYLDVWAELGIVGLAGWLFLLIGFFTSLFGRLFSIKTGKEEANKDEMLLLVGLLGSLAAFGAHSLFETAIFSPVILALLMIILALTVKIGNWKLEIGN